VYIISRRVNLRSVSIRIVVYYYPIAARIFNRELYSILLPIFYRLSMIEAGRA